MNESHSKVSYDVPFVPFIDLFVGQIFIDHSF